MPKGKTMFQGRGMRISCSNPFNTSTSVKREKAEEFGRLGILRNRRSSTVKVDKVNTRENRWFARPSNERIARVPVASYSTVVLARNPEFNASLMSVPFSFGSAAIVANSPPFLPTHPFPYDPSIDRSIRIEFVIRSMIEHEFLFAFFFFVFVFDPNRNLNVHSVYSVRLLRFYGIFFFR